uniref:Uncharacterized protein n=1 Tax=Rhizophora mucronata TaxID=61149 RepID=A0A2P2N4E0_RHIMU
MSSSLLNNFFHALNKVLLPIQYSRLISINYSLCTHQSSYHIHCQGTHQSNISFLGNS